jgi:phage tail-like protein
MKNHKSYTIGSLCMVLATVILLIASAYLVPALAPDSQSNVAQAIDLPDPLVSFHFRLDLEGTPVGYFTECSHIGSESEVVEHKVVDEGGNEIIRKVAGKLAWNNVILSRGVTSDTEMWEWRKLVEDGKTSAARHHVSIIMLGQDGTTKVARWELANAWPCRIEAPNVLGSDEIGIEEIEITCEGMERVTASYSGPEMIVKGNSFEIVDGDVTPSAADGTDFGSVDIATGSLVHTFIIKNIGATQLNLTGDPKVTVGGTCAADFTVTAQPASTVAVNGGSTTFEVTFDPSAAGVRTATISIANDDPDENPFDVALSGNGGTASFSITKTGPTTSKVGDTVTYWAAITNTGDLPLEKGSVSDNVVTGINGLFSSTLLPGNTDNQSYWYVVQAGDPDPLCNIITAHYYPEGLTNVISDNATCTVDLVHPYILVTKYAAAGLYRVGDNITYLVRIDNTSTDITLVKDNITDSLAGDITSLFSDNIAAGGSDNHTYTYTVKVTDPDPLINDVTARYHPEGLTNDIIDSTYATVFLAPTITSVTPNEGNQGQTLDIVIAGSQLNRVNAVDFGAGITVIGFTVNGATQVSASIKINATAALGPRDVTVTNPIGSDTLTGGFTVNQLPLSQPPPVASPSPRASPAPPRPLNPTQLSVKYLSVSPQQTTAGQPVTITTNVVNTGYEAGSYNVILNINGQMEQSRTVSVGPQGTQPVKFSVIRSQPGTYTVNIGDQRGNFTVTGAGVGPGTTMNEGILFAAAMAVIAILVGLLVIVARRRSQGY